MSVKTKPFFFVDILIMDFIYHERRQYKMAIFFTESTILNESRVTKKPENTYGDYRTDAKYETAEVKISKPSKTEWSDDDLKRICDEMDADLKLLRKQYPSQEKKLFEEQYKEAGDWLDYDVVKSSQQLMKIGKESWVVVYHPADSHGPLFEICYNNSSNGKHSNNFFGNHCMVVEISRKNDDSMFMVKHVSIEG